MIPTGTAEAISRIIINFEKQRAFTIHNQTNNALKLNELIRVPVLTSFSPANLRYRSLSNSSAFASPRLELVPSFSFHAPVTNRSYNYTVSADTPQQYNFELSM
ncbi:hypothetical protein VNO78_20667 [Psophocarpus tetragonolobus]|uniref:Uncharacterized protein n=1 Tax=Psophocarpus tetragonolobus TaxID=3891 RepID=A0AAN9SAP6_PSOTE